MISPSHCRSSLNVVFAAFYPSDPEWLSHSVGEILTFDGVKRSKDYYGSLALFNIPALILCTGTKYGVYLAQKDSGQMGCESCVHRCLHSVHGDSFVTPDVFACESLMFAFWMHRINAILVAWCEAMN
jgi:hypothetical protein